jgi:hypothetical protein
MLILLILEYFKDRLPSINQIVVKEHLYIILHFKQRTKTDNISSNALSPKSNSPLSELV